jgi:hypothetical protein
MKFDAENQHAEAFKCRGFDGYFNAGGDVDGIIESGDNTTKVGGLVKKGTEFAQSEKGQAAIAGAKNLFNVGKGISARRNPDEDVKAKCGKKPIRKKKQGDWNKCREETLAARAAAEAGGDSGSTASTENSERSIVTGGTPSQQKSQMPTDDSKKTFDWAKNWWVLPLGLGVIYLGYTKFIKKN